MTDTRIEELRHQIMTLQGELRALTRAHEPIQKDYVFAAIDGPVSLSALFDGREDLITIHNMGRHCAHCTAYADGINGVLHHLENRCAVVLASPDSPEVQLNFGKGRGWKFRMVSMEGTDSEFARDMGFYAGDGSPDHGAEWPGFSAFHLSGDTLVRTGRCGFDPGDEFSPIWPMLELLRDGVGGWHPRFDYSSD